MSIVLVARRTDVPRKAKVRRKCQKKSVPRIDTENIDIDIAWWNDNPGYRAAIPIAADTVTRMIDFLSILSVPWRG
jgi:hypothetical protein